jgi:hypothetical protein
VSRLIEEGVEPAQIVAVFTDSTGMEAFKGAVSWMVGRIVSLPEGAVAGVEADGEDQED